MAAKKTGISPDLLIHPGETIADVLAERGITQAELATRTGVTPAYISNVIAGKKDISAKFAMALEYALGVPKSFWLNLQANYDAELLEYNEKSTISSEERTALKELHDIVKYLRQIGKLPESTKAERTILSLRKVLQISDIANLREFAPSGAFRMSSRTAVNPYVLGAWIRLCQISGETRHIDTVFDPQKTDELIAKLKQIMLNPTANIHAELKLIMQNYGIDFSIVKNFRGAPVQGYIAQKQDGTYQMTLTIRGSYADIFWFSLFHELGHLFNKDVGRTLRFIDDGCDTEKEKQADLFANDKLLNPTDYAAFIQHGDFSLPALLDFAKQQNVLPCIVIGRLQKEHYLDWRCYHDYKPRYKWAK